MLVHAEHWICAMLLMIAIPLSSRTAGQEILEPVQIVTLQWKPYTDASDPEKGIAAKVLTAVFKEMGMQTNYTFMPFDKAMRIAADSQHNDGVRGIFPLYDEPSRRRTFYFSDPLFSVTLRLYYNARKSPQLNQVKRLSDLKDINVVFIESYRYPDSLEKRFSQPIEKVDNGFQAIQYLLDEKNEPCLVPMVEEVAKSVINEYSPDKAYLIKAVPVEPIQLYYNTLKPPPKLNQVKRLSDLKDINAVFIESYQYSDVLEDYFQQPIKKVDNGFQAVQHLLDEDSEPCLVPMADKDAKSVISEYFTDKANLIKAVPVDPFEMQLYFLASRRNPHNRNFIYDDFNKALRRVKNEGVITAILVRAKYESLRRSLVRLTLPAGQCPITGKIDPADPNDFFLPRGTQAEVISWGRAFLEPQQGLSEEPSVHMSLVRIWNGPLKGMELYVDNRFIELP